MFLETTKMNDYVLSNLLHATESCRIPSQMKKKLVVTDMMTTENNMDRTCE